MCRSIWWSWRHSWICRCMSWRSYANLCAKWCPIRILSLKFWPLTMILATCPWRIDSQSSLRMWLHLLCIRMGKQLQLRLQFWQQFKSLFFSNFSKTNVLFLDFRRTKQNYISRFINIYLRIKNIYNYYKHTLTLSHTYQETLWKSLYYLANENLITNYKLL